MSGRQSGRFAEGADKITAAGKSGLLGDQLHGKGCLEQQFFGVLDANGGEVVGEISGKMFLKIHAEIFGRHMKSFAQYFQREVFGGVLLNEPGQVEQQTHLTGVFVRPMHHFVTVHITVKAEQICLDSKPCAGVLILIQREDFPQNGCDTNCGLAGELCRDMRALADEWVQVFFRSFVRMDKLKPRYWKNEREIDAVRRHGLHAMEFAGIDIENVARVSGELLIAYHQGEHSGLYPQNFYRLLPVVGDVDLSVFFFHFVYFQGMHGRSLYSCFFQTLLHGVFSFFMHTGAPMAAVATCARRAS